MVQLTDERLEELKESVPALVGNRIRHFRKENGLTQTQLGTLVGKDRQYIYKIEKGVVTPNIVTLSALVLAMEISLSELLDIEV